jgi:ABC-2 type transport system ATP-binding protein
MPADPKSLCALACRAAAPRIRPVPAPLSPGDRRVVARGLTRRFADRVALQPFDLELGPGGVLGLLGPNGSGKSTLLRILIGLVRPDAGSAVVDGEPVLGDGTAVRRRCAYAPGEIALYGELRAGDHLDWFLRGREREALERARRTARELGLPLEKRVHTFSHGMKRQLLFAAALAPRVGVRILDEVSEGLDPNKRSAVLDLLAEDAAAGTTILLSSHHLGEVDRACDRFAFLSDGRLLALESASTLRERAARMLRLAWERIDEGALERGLAQVHGARIQRTGLEAVIELEHPDPRPALAALAAVSALPAPSSVRYGELSLRELYRDLYGVEAC